MPPPPRRRLDLVLAFFFVLFTIGWIVSDLPKALGFPTEANRVYAQTIDPMFLHPPPVLHAVLKVAGLVYGPCYLALVFALVGRRRWLPKLGVPLGIAMELTTLAYLFGDLFGSLPPKNVPAFLALNGPYAIVPLVLLYRATRSAASPPGSGAPPMKRNRSAP